METIGSVLKMGAGPLKVSYGYLACIGNPLSLLSPYSLPVTCTVNFTVYINHF